MVGGKRGIRAGVRTTGIAVAAAILLFGCTAAATPVPRYFLPQPTPTPFVAASTSSCPTLQPSAGYAIEWQAVVCTAADRLSASRTGMRNLEQAALGRRSEDVIRLAANSTQELSAIKYALEGAPASSAGDSVVHDLLAAVTSYQNAVDDFRYGIEVADMDAIHQASRLLTAADAVAARVTKTLAGRGPATDATERYAEFVEHTGLALKEAYAQWEQLRVANNLVNDRDALAIAESLAQWGQEERNWLIDHPTSPCYTTMKEHWLSWVVTPAYNLGEAYTRWAKLWPYDDKGLWAHVISTLGPFGAGRDKYIGELKHPSASCAASTPASPAASAKPPKASPKP